MRVVFAGTPPFAARALEAIAAAGHEIPLALTQPDRPAGRGLKLTASAVAHSAGTLGIPLFKPATLREAGAVARIAAERPDVMVVAAYGLILPRDVLDVPRRGCLNIHASLLPRWRGAAPVQRSILAGDRETGISIMQMDAGLDTGPVLATAALPIEAGETAGELTDRLGNLGARCIVDALARLPSLVPRAQDDTGATYAAKVTPAEAALDWRRPAADLERQVRAFNPVPGSTARLRGEGVKVWEAALAPGEGPPGRILADAAGRLRVACGSGALELRTVQRAGGRRVPGPEFLRGAALAPEAAFELQAAPGASA